MVGLALGYKLLGFAEKLALAGFFGTSARADAYLAGSGVVLLVGVLLQEIAGPALIPVLVAGRESATRTVQAALGLVLLVMIPLTAACWWAAPGLARLFGPGFDAPTLQLTATIIRIGIFALPALSLAATLIAWSHAQHMFARPALADLVLKICPVIGIALTRDIAGLAFGLVVGAWLRWLLIAAHGAPIRPVLTRADPGLIQSLQAAWPLLLTALVSVHLLSVIETALASTIGVGAVAAYAYARRIIDVPIILIPQVIARIVFPSLTALVLAKNFSALRAHLHMVIRLTLLALIPVAVLGLLLAEPIIRLLLERGAFQDDSVLQTTLAFSAVLPGLPAHALSIMLVRFSYAAGDTRWPSLIRLISAVLHIGLALLLRPLGLTGLGLATTLVQWIEALALTLAAAQVLTPPIAARRWWQRWLLAGSSIFDRALLRLVSQLTVASSIAAGAVLLGRWLIRPTTALGLLIALVVLSSIGGVVYVLTLWLCQVPEARGWLQRVRRWRTAHNLRPGGLQ